jgi:hypothetical protein
VNRVLTETEKTIIGRDATEQRSLSSELNSRASFVGALFALTIGVLTQAGVFAVFPTFLKLFVVSALAAGALFMFYLSRGQQYGYTQPAEKWIEWSDSRSKELDAGGYSMAFLEKELTDGYWRHLAKAARINREVNRQKSLVIKTAGPLSLTLICLALLARLF